MTARMTNTPSILKERGKLEDVLANFQKKQEGWEYKLPAKRELVADMEYEGYEQETRCTLGIMHNSEGDPGIGVHVHGVFFNPPSELLTDILRHLRTVLEEYDLTLVADKDGLFIESVVLLTEADSDEQSFQYIEEYLEENMYIVSQLMLLAEERHLTVFDTSESFRAKQVKATANMILSPGWDS